MVVLIVVFPQRIIPLRVGAPCARRMWPRLLPVIAEKTRPAVPPDYSGTNTRWKRNRWVHPPARTPPRRIRQMSLLWRRRCSLVRCIFSARSESVRSLSTRCTPTAVPRREHRFSPDHRKLNGVGRGRWLNNSNRSSKSFHALLANRSFEILKRHWISISSCNVLIYQWTQ